jgi:mannose-6-phosphate isomerase-like protein (cupin superfamily)
MSDLAPPKGHARTEPDYISPDGAEIRLILRPEVEGTRYHSVCEAVVHAGQVTRAVRHRAVEESWYVLEGEAEVWRRQDGDPGPGTITRLAAGEALNIPPGFAFQARALGSTPLRMLCSTAPPWPGPEEAIPVEGGLGEPTG